MKTARERALDIVYEITGGVFSRAMVVQMAQDDSETGRSLAKMLKAIERGIEADREVMRKTMAPS